MGLRRDVKDGTLNRDAVRALANDEAMSPKFRAWATRFLKRTRPSPGGDVPEGNRAELDVPHRSPRGGNKRRKRNKSKVSKATSR